MRVHVYPSATLRNRAAAEFPDARRWPPASLPQDYLPLLAPGRFAFVPKGKQVVANGGASLEEVVVPLVRIERAVRSPALVAWLAEAALHVRDGESAAPVEELLGQPGLFPFRVPYVTARGLAAELPRLDVAHQGLDTEVVMLRMPA